LLHKLIFSTTLLCLAIQVQAASLDKIRMLTDHWPPYNIVTDGKLSGISVELYELMLKMNKSKTRREDFKITSWKATFDTAKFLKFNAALTMTRNKIRENDFKWVGPIDTKTSGLISKKSKGIRIKSAKDLTKHSIAVVKGYSTHQMLKKAGIRKNLVVTGGLYAVYNAMRKLVDDQVDIYSTSNINYIMKMFDTHSFDANNYEVIKKYKSDTLYFAFNINTDDKIINGLQSALDQLKKDGTYQNIKSKYLKYK